MVWTTSRKAVTQMQMPSRRVLGPGSHLSGVGAGVRLDRADARSQWRAGLLMDAGLVLPALGLAGVGLAALRTVGGPNGGAALWHLQAIWIVVGLAALVFLARVDYRVWLGWRPIVYAVNACMLLAVLVGGHRALGAQRWLQLGPLQLQASEPAKVAFVLTLAALLEPDATSGGVTWRRAGRALVDALPLLALLLLQPDLSTTVVFLAILAGMLFAAGMPWWRLLGVGVGGAALAAAAVLAKLRLHLPVPLHGYQLQRLITFLDPAQAPLGAGYNVLQAQIAIGSGRLVGSGLGHVSARLGFLPAAATDFAFAVLAHDLGFAGTGAVLGLFVLILGLGAVVALRAGDPGGALLASGLITLIGFQVFENVGMALGLLPAAGVPLPWISYGGSAVVTEFAAIGLLLSVWHRRAGRGGATFRNVPPG